MVELRNKKVGVLGIGLAGIATMKFLHKHGAKVKGFGYAVPLDLERAENALKGTGIELVLDETRGAELLDSELIVITTGGKIFEAFLNKAETLNITVLSDLELACLFYKAPIIAVTGSNGKSSVMAILQKVFEAAGKKVKMAGGDFPHFLEIVSTAPDYYLLELSSARLQKSSHFKPHISIFLNLYPGHGERHETFEEYGLAKSKIFAEQGPGDAVIYQFSPDVVKLVKTVKTSALRFRFSLEREVLYGAFYSESSCEIVYRRRPGVESRFSLKNFSLEGPHNVENLMAAICAVKFCGIKDEKIQQVIASLRPLSRRLEMFHKAEGVKFYDDSRSVNMAATMQSLQAFPDKSVVLIAGGDYIRQQFYKALRPVIESKVRCLIIFGNYRERFFKKWEGTTEIYLVVDLEEAVKVAINQAERGNNILFSPAAKPDPTVHSGEPQRSKIFREAVLKNAALLQARRAINFRV